jgi:hypothetical protein
MHDRRRTVSNPQMRQHTLGSQQDRRRINKSSCGPHASLNTVSIANGIECNQHLGVAMRNAMEWFMGRRSPYAKPALSGWFSEVSLLLCQGFFCFPCDLWLGPNNNRQYQCGSVANSEMHQEHGRKRNCHADMRSIPTRPPTLQSTIHCSRQPASVCGCKLSLPSQQPCAGNHWHLPIPVA